MNSHCESVTVHWFRFREQTPIFFLVNTTWKNSEMWSLCIIVWCETMKKFRIRWKLTDRGTLGCSFLWWGDSDYFMWHYSFFMYFPIILWFFARISDTHVRKQFFFLGCGFSRKGIVKRQEKLWNIFSHIWNPPSFVSKTGLVFNLPKGKSSTNSLNIYWQSLVSHKMEIPTNHKRIDCNDLENTGSKNRFKVIGTIKFWFSS